MVNEFKVGDQVAHEEHGNGEVKEADGFFLWCWFDDITPAGNRGKYKKRCRRGELRPRNFLSKIAEEQNEKEKLADQIYQNTIDKLRADKTFDQQFNEVFKDAALHGTGIMKDGKRVPHSEVFNPNRFQRNAYGQLVDTVTGLPADSEGIVKITSIRDSVREIS